MCVREQVNVYVHCVRSLTAMISKPDWFHVERWTDVENMRITAFKKMGKTQLRTMEGGRTE